MQTIKKTFLNGILHENPTFRLLLGMCPALAISTSATNGLGMGLATTLVMICANMTISLLRSFISDGMRIPAFVVIIATFATAVELALKAYVPVLSQSLGLYLPLIVVNCVIFARAESFACKNPPLLTAIDSLACGLGYTLALTTVSIVREIIGNGSFFGIDIPGLSQSPALLFILPPGGFLAMGFTLVAFNQVMKALNGRKKEVLS